MYAYTCIHTHIHAYINAYIHTYVNTFICIYEQFDVRVPLQGAPSDCSRGLFNRPPRGRAHRQVFPRADRPHMMLGTERPKGWHVLHGSVMLRTYICLFPTCHAGMVLICWHNVETSLLDVCLKAVFLRGTNVGTRCVFACVCTCVLDLYVNSYQSKCFP
jgi:hypothetical protein